jgi:hypothetical protein
MKVKFRTFLPAALLEDLCEFHALPLYLTRYTLYVGLNGSQNQSGRGNKKKMLSRIKPSLPRLQPVNVPKALMTALF